MIEFGRDFHIHIERFDLYRDGWRIASLPAEITHFVDALPSPGRYEVGSLAMANAGPDTNGSQFFVISGPNGAGLPPSYALFGKVVSGLDVVEAMQSVPTGAGDRPTEDVVINSVTITETE